MALSLVHEDPAASVDAIFVENLEDDYLLFEQGGRLLRQQSAPRLVASLLAPPEDLIHPSDSVPVGFLQVMCRVAGIHHPEVIPV